MIEMMTSFLTDRKSRFGDAAGSFIDLDDGPDRVVGVLELRVVPVQVLQL